MCKKHSIEFIREQFEKEGYILVSKNYINAHQKLEYICSKGHKGTIKWNSWQQGKRCNVCGYVNSTNKKRHTLVFVREEFRKEGYTLLSNMYINNTQKLEYICPRGHKGITCWGNWSQGDRCAKCYGNKKHTIDFIKKEFAKENYKLLITEYINGYQKLEYICPKGHKNSISWTKWQQGQRCVDCSGKKKLTIELIRQQFEKEEYTLLNKKYINSGQKLKYSCPRGHKGSICWDKWQQGCRCRKCFFDKTRKENHPNWNPNITYEERVTKRKYTEYVLWAFNIKERDNFTCQICGDNRGGNLISHHIESYNSNPKLRTALGNGVCLCESCHKNFHHQYGYGNNTKKQFEEFVNNYNKKVLQINVR